MSKTKILVITSTTRAGRISRKLADWYLAEAKKLDLYIDINLLDIADLDLPVFNEAVPPMMHQYTDLQYKIAKSVGSADGFVFVTAEYNHSISGALKNFMDYINAEWAHKAAAFVGYGTTGGVRAIEHLIQILAELQVVSVARGRDHIHINSPWEALDENGIPKAGYMHGNVEGQLKELIWWADALITARQ